MVILRPKLYLSEHHRPDIMKEEVDLFLIKDYVIRILFCGTPYRSWRHRNIILSVMKSTIHIKLVALAISHVYGHATFQQLWVDGVDMGSQCVRPPNSNSPITNVASTDIRCNVGGTVGVSGKCAVAPGSTVTVEMHQVRELIHIRQLVID